MGGSTQRPSMAPRMTPLPPRSLRHEYKVYIWGEVQTYKASVSSAVLRDIGAAVADRLAAQEQLSFIELVIGEEVNRVIQKRLRLPSYATWRRCRACALAEFRTPQRWGLWPAPTREGPSPRTDAPDH